MHTLLQMIDRFTAGCGRALAWLTLALVAVTVAVVVLRRFFDIGSIALQETAMYLHSAMFMIGAAYTLQRGGHVRVDIFYRRFSARTRAWVDALGTLMFLLPLCGYILVSSWGFVEGAWRIHEGSVDGGLPFVYLLKTLIPLLAIVLALQGVAELLRNAIRLCDGDAARDDRADEHRHAG